MNEMKKRILLELYRHRGGALKIEIAAALLTFVEKIQPILIGMKKEGFVKLGYLDAIYLTKKGRRVVKCLLEKERINRRLRELGWYDLGE